MRWTAPLQRHRNVPNRKRDSLITGVILAFAERLLLANNGHERAFRSRPVYTPKQTWVDLRSRLSNSRVGRLSNTVSFDALPCRKVRLDGSESLALLDDCFYQLHADTIEHRKFV